MKAQLFRLLLPVCVLSTFTGCAIGHFPQSSTASPESHSIRGVIHGGQQPVVGATIQLYTVGTGGDASPSRALLTKTVTTDSSGSFTITDDYSCASATQVYLTATGGNPGISAANPNLLLMAALGPCSALTEDTYLSVNELTTVAAAYALAPFAGSATSIGSGSSDAAGLASAFTLANEYVNTTTGTAPGVNIPAGYSDPTTLLNTLADILSACINTSGGVATDKSTACGTLFSLTPSAGGAAPTDTFTAALNLAQNPGLNTAAIFDLSPAAAPFQPALPQAPADFNLRISATNGQGVLAFALGTTDAFPDEPVNGPTEAGLVDVHNTTISNVTINSFKIIGPAASDYSLAAYCPPNNLLSLSTSEGCTVDLSARASALGERLAYLQINSTAPDSPNYIKLDFSGIDVPTAATYLYLSDEAIEVYNASPSSGFLDLGGGGGDELSGSLRVDYVGNLYKFSLQHDTGEFLISINSTSEGPLPQILQSFNPAAPTGYSFNGAGSAFSATSHFAADNKGQIYIPVQTTDGTAQLGIAVYPPNSTGVTAPSFVLTGYGGKVAVDPNGDLFALDSTGAIYLYEYGVLSTSNPYLGISQSNLLGSVPNARVIDLATDGAGGAGGTSDLYALLYGVNGYEVAEYTFNQNGTVKLVNETYGAGTQLNQPTALAVDEQGNIFVNDVDPMTQKPVVLFYPIPTSTALQTVITTNLGASVHVYGIAVR